MRSTIKSVYSLYEKGKKPLQEDFIYPVSSTPNASSERLFVVCKGIGDGERGEMAARLVGQCVAEYITKVAPFKGEKLGQIYLNDVLRFAERKLSAYQQEHPAMAGLESTMALAYFNENGSVTIGWVGNCRVYHIRSGQILYRTEDHFSNIWQGGRSLMVPRAISGSDSVSASVNILNNVLPGDYVLLTTPGLHQTLDDRNLRYLFSQADGTEGTNQAIMSKMREQCEQPNATSNNFSAQLLQLETTPFTSALTSPQKVSTVPPSGRVMLDTPPPKRKIDIDPEKTMRVALIVGVVLLAVAAAVLLKYFFLNPEKTFAKKVHNAQQLMSDGNYDKAIVIFEEALKVQIDNEELTQTAQKGLQQAQELSFVKQGDDWFKGGDLIKARTQYEEALKLNPQNNTAQQKIDNIGQTLAGEKKRLLASADSLLYLKKFAKAKEFLFDALYIDQKDPKILRQLNLCNKRLSQDSLSLEDALKLATQHAEARGITFGPVKTANQQMQTAVDTPQNEATVSDTATSPRRRNRSDSYNYYDNNNYYNNSSSSGTPYNSSYTPPKTTYYPASGSTYPVSTTTTVPDRVPTRTVTPIEKIEPKAVDAGGGGADTPIPVDNTPKPNETVPADTTHK